MTLCHQHHANIDGTSNCPTQTDGWARGAAGDEIPPPPPTHTHTTATTTKHTPLSHTARPRPSTQIHTCMKDTAILNLTTHRDARTRLRLARARASSTSRDRAVGQNFFRKNLYSENLAGATVGAGKRVHQRVGAGRIRFKGTHRKSQETQRRPTQPNAMRCRALNLSCA